MKRWIVAVALSALSLPGHAQESMPSKEREAYLEACLELLQAPVLAGTQKLGTGEVTRGHATVALFDPSKGNSLVLDCRFTPLEEGDIPTAEIITLRYPDGSSAPMDADEANSLIRSGMEQRRQTAPIERTERSGR